MTQTEQMKQAIENGDAAAVRELLAQGCEADAQYEMINHDGFAVSYTALMQAADAGEEKIALLLLDAHDLEAGLLEAGDDRIRRIDDECRLVHCESPGQCGDSGGGQPDVHCPCARLRACHECVDLGLRERTGISRMRPGTHRLGDHEVPAPGQQ